MTASAPVAERFFAKVVRDPDTECWEWTAALVAGYGRFMVGSKRDSTRAIKPAHRVSYELLVGPIPEGLTLDHLCRRRSCVNPAHLEPVSAVENVMRSSGFAPRKAAQTYCVNGHLLDEANTRVRPNGTRACRACAADRERRRRAQNRPETPWRDVQARRVCPGCGGAKDFYAASCRDCSAAV